MEPERDREWENWPGRGGTDGRARGRLRALFSPTDEEEAAIEALIEARGRELEERTAELTSIVGDLQRREDETRRLRAAVEDLLRDGAAELDERHAQLATLGSETARREEELAQLEAALEERRQELGAVELRRAAVERREESVTEQQTELDRLREEIAGRVLDVEGRLAEIDRRRAELERESSRAAAMTVELDAHKLELAVREAQLDELRIELDQRATETPRAQFVTDEHILVVPGTGYRLVVRPGPAPAVDSSVDVDGKRFRVTRVGRSALPGDRRASAFLEPA